MRAWPGGDAPQGFVRIGGRYVALPSEFIDHDEIEAELERYVIPDPIEWGEVTTKAIDADLLRDHPDLLLLELECDDLRGRFYL